MLKVFMALALGAVIGMFWLMHDSTHNADDFQASWNGTSLLDLVNANSFDYPYYIFTGTAAGPFSATAFSDRENPAWCFVDDVSVKGSAVPIPSSILLLGSGLVGLAVRRFRKK
jgi:hypothetical protein